MEDLKQTIESNLDRISLILDTYKPLRNAIGLLPDAILFSEEYQKVKKEFDVWFKKLQAYNKEEMKKRKANGTQHYIEVHGVKLSRMQELFFGKWIIKNNIAMNILTAEERTEKVNLFLKEKFQ